MNWMPGTASSRRINQDIAPPTTPPIMASTMYMVPMSLWLVEYSHRRHPVGVCSCASWAVAEAP